jgi:hypothetical protein
MPAPTRPPSAPYVSGDFVRSDLNTQNETVITYAEDYADFVAGGGSTAPGKFAVTITGNGAATQFTVTHNLGTMDIHVTVWDPVDDQRVLPGVTRLTTNTVRIDFAVAPANAKAYRVAVIG